MAWVYWPDTGSELDNFHLTNAMWVEFVAAMTERWQATGATDAEVSIMGSGTERQLFQRELKLILGSPPYLKYNPFEILLSLSKRFYNTASVQVGNATFKTYDEFNSSTTVDFREEVAGTVAEWDEQVDEWNDNGFRAKKALQFLRLGVSKLQYFYRPKAGQMEVRQYFTSYPGGTETLLGTGNGDFSDIVMAGIPTELAFYNTSANGVRAEIDFDFTDMPVTMSGGTYYIRTRREVIITSSSYAGGDNLEIDIDGSGLQTVSYPALGSPPNTSGSLYYVFSGPMQTLMTTTLQTSTYGAAGGDAELFGWASTNQNGTIAYGPIWTYP